jgi:3-phytase
MSLFLKNLFPILLFVFFLFSCGGDKKPVQKVNTDEDKNELIKLKPDILSNWNEDDNIDSPAFYKDKSGAYVVATAKSTHQLVVYNAKNGKEVRRIGNLGSELGQFNRPNGVWIYGELCFVVERDNKRIQVLRLPDFEPMLSIGEDRLSKPYGLTVFRKDGKFHLYVTDNYEYEEDVIPADSLLDKRVLHYTFAYNNKDILDLEFVKYIGAKEGEGVLKVVESIYADPVNNNLLIAEELEGKGNTCIKVYDLEGNFKKTVGLNLFESQAEGLALIRCGQKGYWISTDQSYDKNIFHFFDRTSFELIGSFESENLSNTDGIWITQESFDVFSQGAFIAVNNDGGIGVWNLGPLLFQLGISCDNSIPDEADENTANAVRIINKLLLSLYII